MLFVEQIIANWTILIPISISIVSLIFSLITFWFSTIRGPDLVLLNPPQELNPNYQHFKDVENHNFHPTWFELEPITLLFANNGGKDGTILEWNLKFEADEQFKKFIKGVSEIQINPITIEKGANYHVSLKITIYTPEWKKNTLVKLITKNKSIDVEELVATTLRVSKKNYTDFCNFMEKPGELGKLSIEVKITSGRLSTGLKNKLIIKDLPVIKRNDETVSFIRNCLSRWNLKQPTKNQLLAQLRNPILNLHSTLKQNLSEILNTNIEYNAMRQNINSYRIQLNSWENLSLERYEPEKTIKWFLIKTEDGLQQKLESLFLKLENYNNSIDELASLGEQGTVLMYNEINLKRESIIDDVRKMITGLEKAIERIMGFR